MYVITVKNTDGKTSSFKVQPGANLRRSLLKNQRSPYTKLTSKLNCGGNGICATCGVFIRQNIEPEHWHDKLASMFHYPRLSCQIKVTTDMDVIIPSKIIWGNQNKDPDFSDQ